MEAIRILLIDGHELVRYGLRRMLEQEEDMQVVGDCANAEEAFPQMGTLSPDIVLMDIHMPGMNGIEATRCLKRSGQAGNTDIIILTEDASYRAEALEAGATGYLLKDTTRAQLTQLIREAYQSRQSERKGDGSVEEMVELVIPPPPETEATQILRFICQVEEILNDNYDSITRVVGSWDSGTAITLTLRPIPLAALLDKLARLPDLKIAEETPAKMGGFFSLARKLGISRSTTPGRRIRVTLKKTDGARQRCSKYRINLGTT